MLLLALTPLPYGYYFFLRVITFGVGAYTVSLASNQSKKGVQIVFGVVALIFNPIIPFRFDRETWAVIDIVASVLFMVSIFYVRETRHSEPKIELSREKTEEQSENVHKQGIPDKDVEDDGSDVFIWCPKCKAMLLSHKIVCTYCGFKIRDDLCPTCGKIIGKGAVFCSQCGNKIIPSLCEKCGTQNDEDAYYCSKCGNILRE